MIFSQWCFQGRGFASVWSGSFISVLRDRHAAAAFPLPICLHPHIRPGHHRYHSKCSSCNTTPSPPHPQPPTPPASDEKLMRQTAHRYTSDEAFINAKHGHGSTSAQGGKMRRHFQVHLHLTNLCCQWKAAPDERDESPPES